MTVTYRDAVVADAARVTVLARDTFVATFGALYSPANLDLFLARHTDARYAAALADRHEALRLAEADGEAIGFARLRPPTLPFDPGGRHALELGQLYVREAWHGGGVATVLMDWTLAEARARGADDLWLSVYVDNQRARRFYARYGFVEVMPYAFMVGDHADEDIICRLALT